ncbi:MAG: class II aldolase/adducin family protein [Kiritimatiellae bacterium]|jgi:L-fuculose-phosphate aldolase|nr:class II aldolase/adducin family protein [Kiritimatiellia bacterium]
MKLVDKYSEEIEQFIEVLGKLADDAYVTSCGGNAAWRLEDDVILITPTQMYKGDITTDDVVFINMAGETLEGTKRPTGEKPMYLKFFEKRPDIKSVIHCHPPATCATAIMEDASFMMKPFFPETITEIGPVPIVPYAEPLTQKLADNFEPYLQKYNNFVMENHGLVSMTRDGIKWTYLQVGLLEGSVESMIRALSAGVLKEISREGVRDLSNVMLERDLPLMGAPGVNKTLEELYYI